LLTMDCLGLLYKYNRRYLFSLVYLSLSNMSKNVFSSGNL